MICLMQTLVSGRVLDSVSLRYKKKNDGNLKQMNIKKESQ